MPATGIFTQSGAFVQLVAKLVHRLLELEHGEEPVHRRARRNERRIDRRAIAVEELGAGTNLPLGRRVDSTAEGKSRTLRRQTSAAFPRRRASGLRFRRRSGSERAGSPSKSRTTQSSPVHSVWPRWKSPWCRMTRPIEPTCVHSRSRSRTSSPRPRIGARSSLSSGQLEEDALDVVVDRRRQHPERLGGRLLGAEVRIGRDRCRAACAFRRSPHRAGAGCAGTRSSPSPFGIVSSASSQPSRPPGDEPLEDPQRRVHRPP